MSAGVGSGVAADHTLSRESTQASNLRGDTTEKTTSTPDQLEDPIKSRMTCRQFHCNCDHPQTKNGRELSVGEERLDACLDLVGVGSRPGLHELDALRNKGHGVLLLEGSQELRLEHEALAEPSKRATCSLSHCPLRVGVKIVLELKLGGCGVGRRLGRNQHLWGMEQFHDEGQTRYHVVVDRSPLRLGHLVWLVAV